MFCKINQKPKTIDTVQRRANGNIVIRSYCSNRGEKFSHLGCDSSKTVYTNGEGYDLKNRKITFDNHFPNLIGCWCNEYLRFSTPVEAQNHRLETHPEEFED
jgi:hypothetical protein